MRKSLEKNNENGVDITGLRRNPKMFTGTSPKKRNTINIFIPSLQWLYTKKTTESLQKQQKKPTNSLRSFPLKPTQTQHLRCMTSATSLSRSWKSPWWVQGGEMSDSKRRDPTCYFWVPSRELTYPTLGKGSSSSKIPCFFGYFLWIYSSWWRNTKMKSVPSILIGHQLFNKRKLDNFLSSLFGLESHPKSQKKFAPPNSKTMFIIWKEPINAW